MRVWRQEIHRLRWDDLYADVETVQRYIKLLWQRGERNPVDRLDSYLRATLGGYFSSPLRPPRVSPCMGLGLIGCGGAVGGAGAGFVAMTLILRPFRQGDHPGGDFDHQHDKPNPKHQE
jgi:hypothetical protein